MTAPEKLEALEATQRAIHRALQWFPLWARGLVAFGIAFGCVSAFLDSLQPAMPGEPAQAFWVTLILFAATLILNEYMRPKPPLEDARPSGVGDFNIPTATEGRIVPILWGRARIDGTNIVDHSDVRQEGIYTKVKTGLWSSKTFRSGFRNYVAFQQGICRGGGSNVALRGMWVGETKVWEGNQATLGSIDIDEPDLFGGDDLGTGGYIATVDFFTGSSTQAVSDFLDTSSRQRILSATTPTAPRYVDQCYMVVRELGVVVTAARGAYIGNSTDVKAVGVDVERFPDLFTGQTAGQNKIGTDGDCNPINAVYEYLTDTDWGLGQAAADIDTASFLAASDTVIAEGYGFSMVIDQPFEGDDILKEFERHIDGVIFYNIATGKWKITLARDDYDINTVPEFDETNSAVTSFQQSTWEDTTNQVQVFYFQRDNEYKETYALAQDMANALIRGDGTVSSGQIVSTQPKFPGVKSSEVAANIAWRELRTLSYPLAKATFRLKRQFWDLEQGSVIAWTSEKYGHDKLPMRVLSIDYGTLDDNVMVVETVQSVFYYALPSFGTPQATGWEPPTTELVAYPAGEQVIIESPRALTARDPSWALSPNAVFRLQYTSYSTYVSAVRQSSEHGYYAAYGSETIANGTEQFMQIGTLAADIDPISLNPLASISVTGSESVANNIDGALSVKELGESLAHLILIDDEFMLVKSASYSAGTLTLSGIYRGTLDSVQRAHTAGATVYFLFLGGSQVLNSNNYPQTFSSSEDFRLRMYAPNGTYAGATTDVTLSNTRRAARPYPPSMIFYNGSTGGLNTPALEHTGTIGSYTFDVDWWKRSNSTLDEATGLTFDEEVESSTEYQLEVRVDPDGADTQVLLSAWTAGSGPIAVSRLAIIAAAPAGTVCRFLLRSRWDFTESSGFQGTTFPDIESQSDFLHDVTPTSILTGKFYFGGDLRANDVSASYTAASAGTHVVNIGSAYGTSNVQYRLNGGTWTTVIAAGATTGNIAGVSISDTIEVRHTTNEAPDPQFVELRDALAVIVAYGAFSA